MPEVTTVERLRGLILSAIELREMHKEWSPAMIEDYLNIFENFVVVANLLDIEIDQKIEEISTDFSNGSIPFAEGGFLTEDNSNLSWDNINNVLNVLAVKLLGLTPASVLFIDSNNIISEDTANFTWDDVAKLLSALYILTDKISFNLSVVTSPGEGELSWNDDDGTLNLGMPGGNVIQQIGLEGLVRITNKTGSVLENGKLVYITGAQGNRLTVDLADNTDANKIFILGMVTEDIADNGSGYVALWGDVRGSTIEPIDTSSFAEGDKLYLSTLGDWTNVHPTSSTHAVVVIGTVRRSHATEGIIYITRPESFTIGNEFDGTIRQSVINKSTGISAASGFTAVNNLGYFTTMGIAGSNNAIFPNSVSIYYAPGYGDHWQAVDGAKDFVWFTDPSDSHDNSSLDNEVMRLVTAGHLKLVKDNSKMMWGDGDDASIYYDGVDLWIKTNEVAPSDLLLECGPEKTIELQNVVWDDLRVPALSTKVGAATFQPTWTQIQDDGAGSRGVYTWTFSPNLTNEVFFAVQMPHTYKEGTDLEPHVHWSPLDTAIGGVRWVLEYTISNVNGIFGNTAEIVMLDQADGTALKHQVAEDGVISGAGLTISHMLICRLYRDATHVDDDYTGSSAFLEFDIHHEINTMGSRQEFIK